MEIILYLGLLVIKLTLIVGGIILITKAIKGDFK
jgi:hypothetical protein